MAFPSLLLSIQLLTRTELDAASSENQDPFPDRFAVGDLSAQNRFFLQLEIDPLDTGR